MFGREEVSDVILWCAIIEGFMVLIPWVIFVIWESRMEHSDPVRWHQLTRARQEFKANIWRELKTVVGKHLRK